MPNRRYHIHVVCADNDQLLVLDNLAVFFQSRAFLTYDVSSKLPKASLYGRQCIDACDYAIIVIGDSYGTVQSASVSQMHLSYLNVKAKQKPLLVLIKTHKKDADISRQLQDFTRTVEQQAKHVYYYDTDTNIEQILIYAYNDMVANNEVKDGWLKASEEVARYKKQMVFESNVAELPPIDAVKSDSDLANTSTFDKKVASGGLSKPIGLADTFDIEYNAQAYAGGNLTDVVMPMALTWRGVLQALTKMPTTFSSYGLQSCINRMIASQAETDIKARMPNVHAVSRCQISQNDLNKLQRQLVAANWIQLTTYGTRVSQELWKLTFYARNLLEDKPLNIGD